MAELTMNYSTTIDPNTLWWEDIAGPSRLVWDLKTAFVDGHSVACDISSALSFRHDFRNAVSHWLFTKNVTVDLLDCRNDYSGEDITEYLVKALRPDLLLDYQRRRSPQYIRDKQLLYGRLLWIRGVDANYYRTWLQFISSYRSNNISQGLFLFEMQNQGVLPPKFPQNLKYFSYEKYVKPDDLRLFASILSENYLDESAGVKQYAVELIASLCVTDGELAYKMLSYSPFYRDDPIQALSALASVEYVGSPRGQETGHPLSLLRKGNRKELSYRVWCAQVRVGYPKIELERLRFINSRLDDMQQALSTPYLNEYTGAPQYLTDYEGNRITSPYDVEVGMLVRMMNLKRYDNESQRLLSVSDPVTRDLLHLLRNCRNDLAHLEVCPTERFLKLVEESY